MLNQLTLTKMIGMPELIIIGILALIVTAILAATCIFLKHRKTEAGKDRP